MTIGGSIEPACSHWDYFLGGVPPLSYFDIECHEIEKLVTAEEEPEEGLGFAPALGLIGLVAYFEAFCRALFSASINICPETLEEFVRSWAEFAIPLRDLIRGQSPTLPHIGFLVAERTDFGNARAINSAFVDLLRVSPFSKDEGNKFDRLLRVRHALVHYGGIETLKYPGAHHEPARIHRRVFLDAVSVKKTDTFQWSTFLKTIAVKASTAASKALDAYIDSRQVQLTVEARKAKGLLLERMWATQ